MSISLVSCQAARTPLKTSAIKEPKVRPVKVHNNCICGKDLDNVIKNHLDVWKLVDELKAKGCFKK